ncbi:hypothetical protein V5D56_02210 [Cellulosimicrobium sp. PMB13]|uniref:hypothetical protein n=1 Tax=Cellulosimicrobium sp. PMB13 TaxID=3120158 RepID=UPI003F4B2EFE
MSTYSSWRSDHGNMQALSEELEAQAAMARSREASLNRRLRSLEGDLSSRVEVLQRLVNALIELGEVREELALLTPARRARDAARALVRAVVSGEGDVSYLRRSPDLADVHGYWLVPAALAVADVREGRLDDDAAQEALVRDRRRAATFLVGVCALVGQPGLAAPWLSSVLDTPALPDAGWGTATEGAETERAETDGREVPDDVSVAVAERALWLAAAAGLLGDAGDRTVRDALAQRTGLLDAGAHDRLRGALLAEPPALGGGGGDDWGSPSGVRDELGVLRAWAAWARAAADGALLPAPPTGDDVPVAADAAVAGVPLATDPARAALQTVVSSVVDEGAPVERDLLDRADELNARVGRERERDQPAWDAPAASLVDLLAADARGDDPDRARLVAPILAEDLKAAAHDLAARLAAEPAPSRTLRLAGRTVTVTPTDDGERPAATARAELVARPVDGISWPVVGGLGAAAVVALVLAVVTAPAWWLVVAGAAAVAGWQWFAGTRRSRDQREHVRRQVALFDAEIVRTRQEVVDDADRARSRREAVADVVVELDEALAEVRG